MGYFKLGKLIYPGKIFYGQLTKNQWLSFQTEMEMKIEEKFFALFFFVLYMSELKKYGKLFNIRHAWKCFL